MTIKVDKNSDNVTIVMLNGASCLMWIQDSGMRLNGTIFPQPGVDYIDGSLGRNSLRIIGVDLA